MWITQSSHLIICAYICVQEGETLFVFFYSITFVFSPCDLCNWSSDLLENCHSLEIWPVNQEVRTLAQKPDAGIFVLVKTQENRSLRSCFLSSLIIQRENLLYVAKTKQTFIKHDCQETNSKYGLFFHNHYREVQVNKRGKMKGRAYFNNISIIFIVSWLGKKIVAVFQELFVIDNVSATVKSKVPVGRYILFLSVWYLQYFH